MGFLLDRLARALVERRWLAALAAINFAGFLFGVYYYWPQLAAAQAWQWPFVFDSPLPVLLFSAACVLLLTRKQAPKILLTFAFFGLVKYGLWTVLAIVLFAGPFFGSAPLVYAINLPGHALMALEGAVLATRLRPKAWHIATVGGFYLANDALDYAFAGTRTWLPSGGWDWLLAIEAFASTLLLVAWLVKLKQKRV